MIYGGNEIRRKEKQRAVETNRIMNFKRVMGGKKERTPLFTVIRIFFFFISTRLRRGRLEFSNSDQLARHPSTLTDHVRSN